MNPHRKSWNLFEGIEAILLGTLAIIGLIAIPVLILISEENIKAKSAAST